jgi:hypothetical protein
MAYTPTSKFVTTRHYRTSWVHITHQSHGAECVFTGKQFAGCSRNSCACYSHRPPSASVLSQINPLIPSHLKPTTCTLYYALKCANYTPTCFEPLIGSSSGRITISQITHTHTHTQQCDHRIWLLLFVVHQLSWSNVDKISLKGGALTSSIYMKQFFERTVVLSAAGCGTVGGQTCTKYKLLYMYR